MQGRAAGGLPRQIAAEVRKHISIVTAAEIATALGREGSEVEGAIAGGTIDAEIRILPLAAGVALLSPIASERAWRAVRRAIVEHQHRCPLSDRGLDAGRIAPRLCLADREHGAAIAEAYLSSLAAEGRLRTGTGGWLLPDFHPAPTPAQREALERLRRRFRGAGMGVPVLEELEAELTRELALTAKDVKMLLAHLVEHGELQPIDDAYVWKETVDRCRQALVDHLAASDEGITVAGFRDLVEGNRKICLLLLGLYDREGITRREGDLRYLTTAGRAMLTKPF
jgi:selenocysteine-specific elongation factor